MGYFDDDGTEINPDFLPKPPLCISCSKNDKASEEIVCNLTRLDQVNEKKIFI